MEPKIIVLIFNFLYFIGGVGEDSLPEPAGDFSQAKRKRINRINKLCKNNYWSLTCIPMEL